MLRVRVISVCDTFFAGYFSVKIYDILSDMEATPLQQLSMAVSMLLLLVLVMKPKLRATLGQQRVPVERGEQENRS